LRAIGLLWQWTIEVGFGPRRGLYRLRSAAYDQVVDIRHLKCFVVVAEELHFGRAAARLHIAQPAISQTVIGLERELGLVLFERSNRRVELTDAGRALLGEARGVLDRFDGTLALAERLRSGTAGRVNVAVTPALPPNLLTELLAVFRAAAPDVKVVAKSVGDVPDPLSGLGGRFDLAILRGQIQAPGIASVVVATEPVGVALPSSHRLASSESVSARSLAGEPLAAFPRAAAPAEFDRIFAVLAAAGLDDVGEIHESPPGAVDASLRLVAAGEALSLKLRSEVDAFGSAGVVWVPFADVDLSVVVSAAWRFDVTSPATRRLVDALSSWLNQRS
jgi:DNA-binding transcriptional LysR family regulator